VNVVGKPWADDGAFKIKLRVREFVVPGDLSRSDVAQSITLTQRSPFDSGLADDHTYVMFISKDIPGGFSWWFRNECRDANTLGAKEMASLKRLAEQAYKASDIYRFRKAKPDTHVALPLLDSGMKDVCRRFRQRPSDRAAEGRGFGASDFGSRPTPRPTCSSVITYDRPKARLTRGRVINILGQPSMKCGYTYYWDCGIEPNPTTSVLHGPRMAIDKSKRYRGLLTVTFEQGGTARYLRYTAYTGDGW
jgi:hypothetical protein